MPHTIIVDCTCDITDDMRSWTELTVVSISDKPNGTAVNKTDKHSAFDKFSGKKIECPCTADYYNAICSGASDIYIITASDELSDSYEQALTAADAYRFGRNDKNVHVFNSHGFGGVEALLAIKIKSLIDNGADFKTVVMLTEYTGTNKTECIMCCKNSNIGLNRQILLIKPMARLMMRLGIRVIMSKIRDGKMMVYSALTKPYGIAKLLSEEAIALAENYGGDKKTALVSYKSNKEKAQQIADILSNSGVFNNVFIAKSSWSGYVSSDALGYTISIAA